MNVTMLSQARSLLTVLQVISPMHLIVVLRMIPIEISYIVGIVIWFLFQYFTPLEEYDDSNSNR